MKISTSFNAQDLRKRVPLGEGLYVPHGFRVTAEGEELPYRVELYVQLHEGRFTCEQLTCRRLENGLPVTTEGIRELPIGEIIRRGAEGALVEAETLDDGTVKGSPLQLPSRPLEGGPTEEVLKAVAAVYKLAYATGAPPAKAVMQRLGIPRSTAGRWVMLARKAGLLGAAAPGKAGEERGG